MALHSHLIARMKYPEVDSITNDELAGASGGLRWQGMRRSTNIEDRRSPEAIQADKEWWNKILSEPQPPLQPLPKIEPPRPLPPVADPAK